jgi:hypothetical protein
MRKNDPTASIEKMSLSELTALEAKAIEAASGVIAPEEPNVISDKAENGAPAFKREMSSH